MWPSAVRGPAVSKPMLFRKPLPSLAFFGLLCLAGAGPTRPVVGAPAATPLVTNLSQVNHVLVDGDWLYWTEASPQRTRLRKAAKTGGPIIELTDEATVNLGQANSYVHLQAMGDRIYFSRLSSGFAVRWSVYSIPKGGGERRVEVPEEVTIRPLSPSGWQVAETELVVCLQDPTKVGLPDDTRIGAYNPGTATWRPLLRGVFPRGRVYITAVHNDTVYVRGTTAAFETRTGKFTLAETPVYTELLAQEDDDRGVGFAGATDGVDLYFWSRIGGKNRLRKIPVSGGASSQVQSGTGSGLTFTEEAIYWATGKKVQRRTLPSGPTARIFSPIFDTAALGGLTFDEDFLYLVQKRSNRYDLVRIAK